MGRGAFDVAAGALLLAGLGRVAPFALARAAGGLVLGVVLALAWSGGASTALLTSLPEIALLLLLVGEAGTARCVVGTVLLGLHALLPVAGMFVLGLRRA